MKEEIPYPQIGEEDGSCFTAEEPAGSVAYTYTDDPLVSDMHNIPGLPQTWDELQECIEEGELEYERGEAIPWEKAVKSMKAHIKEYAA